MFQVKLNFNVTALLANQENALQEAQGMSMIFANLNFHIVYSIQNEE